MIQKTDWGQIQWLDEDGVFLNEKGLKTGIVTLYAGAHQTRHIHFEEQVLYVLKGNAVSYIGGKSKKKIDMHPGDCFHWQAGILHELCNDSEQEFVHLLVSNPEHSELMDQPEEMNIDVNEISSDLLYTAVEAIRTQFLESLPYTYIIKDTVGNIVLQSKYYPNYCNSHCAPGHNSGYSPCMFLPSLRNCNEEQVFTCPFGMKVFHYPIIFHERVLGYIQGGYVCYYKDSEDGDKANIFRDYEVYEAPESVVSGIHSLFKKTVKAIRNYCEFEQFRREQLQKELRLSTTEAARQMLAKELHDTQYENTDLKINNHFLFNTLNSMASMAVEADAMNLYHSIVALSKMFHYGLRTKHAMVRIKDEMEYVNSYLQLQKLRYGENLEMKIKIDPEAEAVSVPFNFIQPIVENAFIHGYRSNELLTLEITMERCPEQLSIKIENSGNTLTEAEIKSLNRSLKAGVSHGLSMVYTKLYQVYVESFEFIVNSGKSGGICVSIGIPLDIDGQERGDSK